MTEAIFCNGIDARSGNYLPAPTFEELLASIRGADPEGMKRLKEHHGRISQQQDLSPVDEVEISNLGSTGWGVIFAEDVQPQVRDSLMPLLKRRQEDAGSLYREFWRETGLKRDQSKEGFLLRHGAERAGPVQPENMPYYLLLVGSPEQIPFEFQHELGIQHAVGRLYFENNDPQQYENYARTVEAAEEKRTNRRRAVFFAPRNAGDYHTERSLEDLVMPLADKLASRYPAWTFDRLFAERATKNRLSRVLGGSQTPALLFTATHGIGLPSSSEHFAAYQGALLCQEWPGPRSAYGSLLKFSYSSRDLDTEADLDGMIAIHFACYSAATPADDDFDTLAEPFISYPFASIASLPQKLLGAPGGSALAVIGHVDRVFLCSFYNQEIQRGERIAFEQCLGRLLRGCRVGFAMELFSNRWAELSAKLSNLHFAQRKGKRMDEQLLASTWLAANDARNYILLGDPAVRLCCEE